MSLRERWNELGTGGKIAIVLVLGVVGLLVLVPVLVVASAVVASFALGVGGGGEAAMTPVMDVEVTYETDDGEHVATLTHDGGDAVQAENVVVVVQGEQTQWQDADGEITAGDTFTVPVPPETGFELRWTGGEEEEATLYADESPTEAEY